MGKRNFVALNICIIMSKRLYVIFKPSEVFSLEEMVRRINARFPETAKVSDGDIDLNGKYAGYITRPNNCDGYPDFPYWCFYFWLYWDKVLNGMDFRQYVADLCNALGTNEWWYIEEESTDLYDDLNTEEYERVLAISVGIENFKTPHYFPNSVHHFFKDSTLRVYGQISL